MKREIKKFKYKWEFSFETHYGTDDGSFLILPILAIQINSKEKGVMIGWLLWMFSFEYVRVKIYN